MKGRQDNQLEASHTALESGRREAIQPFINAITESALLIEPNGTVLAVNEVTARRLGQTVDTLLGQDIYEFIPPEVATFREEQVEQVLVSGEPTRFEDRRAGRVILNSVYPILDAEGAVIELAIFGYDITEQTDMRVRLEESEQKLRSIINHAPLGIALVDEEGRPEVSNPALEEMLGYSAQELRETPFVEFTHPDDAEMDEALYRELYEGNRDAYAMEKRYIRKDGSVLWGALKVSVIRDTEGAPRHAVGMVQDITEAKRAEAALRESEKRYRTLAEASPDMIFVIGRDDTVRYVNQVAATQFGVDPHRIVGARREELFPPQISGRQREALHRVMETGERLNEESRVIFPDGEAWLSTWLVPISRDGQVEAVLGISRDITGRKRAERALEERVKELTCLHAVHRDVQREISPGDLCQRIVEHLVPAMEFPGLTVPVLELDGERYTTDAYTESLSHGLHASIDVQGKRRGKASVYYTEERPFLLPEQRDMLANIAETLSLWLERRETSQEMARIFDMSLDLICIADMKTATFTRVNPAFTETLGYSEDTLLSHPFLEFIHPDDVEPTNALIAEKLSQGEKVMAFENRYRHEDGGYRWLSWVSHPEPGSGRLYAVARDVTEQKRAEQELRRHREELQHMVEERTRVIRQQTEEILELSTPVLEVMEGVVVVPLIGTLDARRAERFTEVLLNEVASATSEVALIDITGVPALDTQTAQYLIDAITATRLLGADVILTGVRPAIAQALVQLGIDLGDLTTRSSLSAGLEVAQGMIRR